MKRSTNCKAYTDAVSLLCTGTAEVEGREECTIDLDPTFSCQKDRFQLPDQATSTAMQNGGFKRLKANGCCVEGEDCNVQFKFHTNVVGAQSMEHSAEQLKKTGLASNCHAQDNDFNNATHKAMADCHPMYDMTKMDTGERVRDTTMAVRANLHVCDITEEVMPQVMSDLRKVAAHNLLDKGYKLDREADLACKISVLPFM